MGQARVIGVLADDAPQWWDRVGPWIEAALDASGLLSLDDVKASVAWRDMQLWLVMENAEPVAACVTEISDYPRARVLTAVATGGDGVERWIGALDAQLTRFGLAHDCTKFNAPEARRGWRPFAKALGWRESANFWKDLG